LKGIFVVEDILETCGCGERKERIRKKEKGKEINKRRYFLLDSKVKLMKRLIPGFKSKRWKTFRKIPKSSEIQVSRNDS